MRDLETILAHVRVTPPTCVIAVAPQRARNHRTGDDQTVSTEFRIGCVCGCRSTRVLGYSRKIDGGSLVLSPLALHCPECDKVTEFFDSDRHGYDPEVCGDTVTMRGSGERKAHACVRCGHDLGQPATTFTFNNATEILVGLPGHLHGREQDAFDWFTLEFTCASCGTREVVTDFERA